jgi:hypothetical protein
MMVLQRLRIAMKKIAFVISSQHLIPHGGIGSFCKSFCEMQEEMGNEVHIIMDKKPGNNFTDSFINPFGTIKIKCNQNPLSYAEHTGLFMNGESVNYEKIVNFQTIIREMLAIHEYDYILCNSQESFDATVFMPECQNIKVILYTHLYKQIYPEATIDDVFLESYHKHYNILFKAINSHDMHTIGTQSKRNLNELIKQGITNVKILPMPMSEQTLLTENYNDRKGVLYIGRWEVGKNPKTYIKVMKECGLPCKVMTNSSGAKKFEKAFTEAGITDYEIKAGITGKEKVDFIKSCKVSFNCSLVENYSFAFIECVGHMPVVVLDTQDWSDNFDKKFFTKVSVKDASKIIIDLYGTDINERYKQGSLEYVKELNQSAKNAWKNL